MRIILKLFLYLFIILLILYFIILILFYFFQEKAIFYPEKLPADYTYTFERNCNEKWIVTSDAQRLNALLFKADSAKGIILYLHGNAGNLDYWGYIASNYTNLGYDILIPDYRGFGKSSGEIYSEEQVFADAQLFYNLIKKDYPEEKIIVIGYSIGTCPATYLAFKNQPSKLVLMAPYYNLPDLVSEMYKIVPPFVFRYPFKTNQYILKVKAPIALFHGNRDKQIPYTSSKRLFKLCKENDKLYLLPNQGHAGIDENIAFLNALNKFLAEE
jgi:alpha-beta hydrolase superfamily lysophospholipase